MVVSASSYALGFLAIILANSSIFINIGRLVIVVAFIVIIDIVSVIILIILKNLAIIHANTNEQFRLLSNFSSLYSRFLNGLGLGLVIATVSVYIVEIATADMRVPSK